MFLLSGPHVYVSVNAIFSCFCMSSVVWERLEGALTSSCLCTTLFRVHYWYCSISFQHFKYFGCHWLLLASSLRYERRGPTLSQFSADPVLPLIYTQVKKMMEHMEKSVQLTLITTVSCGSQEAEQCICLEELRKCFRVQGNTEMRRATRDLRLACV